MTVCAIEAYGAAGSANADELVRRHAGLVKRIALHVSTRLPDRVLLDDLIQAGLLGLLEAARNFDESVGASFETFASNRIRGAMWDEARRMDWTPRSVHRKLREASAAMRTVEHREGRHATDAEVAEELGVDADAYAAVLRDAQASRLLSLDQEGDDDDGPSIVPEDPGADPARWAEADSLRDRVADAIASLPEREQLLLSLYYQEELNLREIGEVLGVTESRVCQLHGRAVLRLRSYLEARAAV